MNTSTLHITVQAIIVAGFLLLAGLVPAAQAGELSVYLKSGYFSWDEKLNGASFVKERGAMHAAGLTRKDELAGLTFAELIEVWGGSLDYDGHDVTGSSKLTSDTTYLGTREEATVGIKLPVASAVSFEPFVGFGHKFWIRTRSGEDWNSIYAKVGLGSEIPVGANTVFLRGGALLPIYTRNHVSLTNAGYSDVVTEPKSRVSAFAEAGVKRGPFALSVEYEGLRFGQSEKVATTRLAKTPGAVVQNNQAFQPDSDASLFSVKLAYSF